MKKTIILVMLLLTMMISDEYTITKGGQLILNKTITVPYTVIPGLYGFGTDTRAAYGGTVDPVVLHVDTLAGGVSNTDSTHGTFKWCVQQTYPRIVVFDVSGVINEDGSFKNGYIDIVSPYLTIAGQTAPDSVILNGGGIRVRTHDVVIQHFAIRNKLEATIHDCLSVESTLGPIYNVILDHLSATQAGDEPIAFWNNGNDIYDITISNSIIGAVPASQETGPALMGIANFGFIKNLITTFNWRGPIMSAPFKGVIYNNLIYNWRNSVTLISGQYGGDGSLSYAGNHAIGGAFTTTVATANMLVTLNSDVLPESDITIYMADNIKINDEHVARHDINDKPGNGYITSNSPINANGYIIESASTTKVNVLANVGPRPKTRDTVDTGLISNVKSGLGLPYPIVPDVPAELKTTSAFVSVSNPHEMYNSNYTNLEHQLHLLAAAVEPAK